MNLSKLFRKRSGAIKVATVLCIALCALTPSITASAKTVTATAVVAPALRTAPDMKSCYPGTPYCDDTVNGEYVGYQLLYGIAYRAYACTNWSEAYGGIYTTYVTIIRSANDTAHTISSYFELLVPNYIATGSGWLYGVVQRFGLSESGSDGGMFLLQTNGASMTSKGISPRAQAPGPVNGNFLLEWALPECGFS